MPNDPRAAAGTAGADASGIHSVGIDDTLAGDETSAPDRSAPRPLVLERGETVSRYVVLEEVGRGAMGIVYLAIDPDLERKIAIKVLRRENTRVLGEARALARLAHSNVVGVYDVGEVRGRPFVAMEYVDGASLDAWLAEEDRGWGDVVDTFIKAGRGLAAAHAAGLIHRDFKPANVMVARDGRVKVTDFGLAHASESNEIEKDLAFAYTTGRSDLTATQGRLGTPAYMAPELHHGEPASTATDQFSFCVALHVALYGEHPFDGTDVVSLMASVVSNELRDSPAGSTVPTRVRRVLAKGLSPESDARFESMSALVDELARIRAPSRRTLWVTTAAGGIGLCAWVMLRAGPIDVCLTVDTEVESAWTDSTGASLRAAFDKSGLSFAARAGDEAVATLDAYALQWRELRKQACRQRTTKDVVAVTQAELTEHCLERARSDLQAVADVLVAGAPKTVTHATELVHGLPPLSACADPKLAASLPIPEDPKLRSEVSRVRAMLSQVKAQRVAARPVEDEMLSRLAEDADVLDFAPLRAEVAMERAHVRAAIDEDSGVRMFEEALQLAVEGGADLIAAAAVGELLGIDGDGRGETQRAHAWEQLVRGYLRRWPDRGRLRVKLEGALSRTLSARGEFDEAIALASSAADRAEALHDPWRASLHRGNYGLVLTRAGRLPKAIETLTAHVEHTVALYGADHPESAWAYNALGNVYIQLQDGDGAHKWCLRSAEAYRLLDGHDRERGQALNNLANAHSLRGEVAEAYDIALEALKNIRQHTQRDHPTTASLLNNLGSYCDRRGEPAQAVKYFRESLQMQERLGSTPLQRLLPVANLAASYAEAGDAAGARRQLEQTVELLEDEAPDNYPLTGRVYFLVGHTYREIEDLPNAVKYLGIARRELESMLGPDSETTQRAAKALEAARAAMQ